MPRYMKKIKGRISKVGLTNGDLKQQIVIHTF